MSTTRSPALHQIVGLVADHPTFYVRPLLPAADVLHMDRIFGELLALTTVPLFCEWLGISFDLFETISTTLGGTPFQIAQIALIPYSVWDKAIRTLPRPPHEDPDAVPDIGPTASEWGSINSLRMTARIICNLPADEDDQSQSATQVLPPSQSQSELKSTLHLYDLVNPMSESAVK
jgi:hypothetical protein